jgi:FtsP/CotA-like multicopper oxidase with cupredoxin domain
MQRREFLELAAVSSALSLGCSPGSMLMPHVPSGPLSGRTQTGRAPLVFPTVVMAGELTLTARARIVDMAPGLSTEAWSPGDGPVGPTIRARTGETARIRLENALPESTILHWHGLRVPEASDGHPRLAIAPGATYLYEFPVIDRAGTYWYHAHPHHRTGIQVYRGMAGLLLVGDAAEEALGLPQGDHEIPLLVQDRRVSADGTLAYETRMQEQMEGFFGDVPFANGIRLPEISVDTSTYRLRVVNGTTSRILRLALSNGQAMTLIGNDGGLLPAPVTVSSVDLGTGERADLLVDFSSLTVGTRIALLSAEFQSPVRLGGMGMGGMGMGGMGSSGRNGLPQGAEMRLVEFAVARAVTPVSWRSIAFPAIPALDSSRAVRTRTFRFDSAMMRHSINGRAFDLSRIDETVRFGDTEVWTFVNDSPFPHPVHMHAVQFQILERTGGRSRLFPWERGLKDTVLLLPGERVSVIAAFDRYRGRFLMHCHNLVHEDLGMMMNYEIV